ncbi:MAG TPA: c-type cytochrome [Acidimicrobiales bacterium]|nr:c-type cytochrome [Acidimicrobiales bacterium]
MTEIPEHLLKRSKERRSAIGGDDAPADAAPASETPAAAEAPAAAAPAVPAAAAVEVAPPPKPERPEVAAARRRKKIPFWAMPVLAGLPLWAYVYQATLEPPPADESSPFVLGETIYGGCASCHGAGGGGGTGPAFAGVMETWPDFRDHMMWVRLGSSGWPTDVYGATNKPKVGGMPAHASLTDAELAQVVLYERAAFGGLEEGSEEYLALEEIANGLKTFADVGLGEMSVTDGVDESNLGAG